MRLKEHPPQDPALESVVRCQRPRDGLVAIPARVRDLDELIADDTDAVSSVTGTQLRTLLECLPVAVFDVRNIDIRHFCEGSTIHEVER